MQGSKQHHTRSLGLSIGRWPNVTAFDHTASAFPERDKNQGRSVFIEKSWLIESLRSHFRNIRSSRVYPAWACTGNDGATSSRASDVDALERMLVISPRELKVR